MFIPQSRVLNRLADCRLSGYPDVNTEEFYGMCSQTENNETKQQEYIDKNKHRYDQCERMDKMINDIVVDPDILTDVNMNGSTQQEYVNTMTDKLSNSGFNTLSQPHREQTRETYIEPQQNYQPSQQIVNTQYRQSYETQPSKQQKETFMCEQPIEQPQQNTFTIRKDILYIVVIIVTLLVVFLLFVIIFKSINDIKLRIQPRQLGGYIQSVIQPSQQLEQQKQTTNPGGYSPYYF